MTDIPDQSGQVAIVTGANSGLGFETALALAANGATTILACRSKAKAEEACARIVEQHPKATVQAAELDVSELASVRAFAKRFLAKRKRLDLLINNAGVMATPQRTTADGFELQFATNHLGPFALTGLLMKALLASPASRVVALSSLAARTGRIDFGDLMGARRYEPWKAYGQSKLADLMFARELQRRLAAAGITQTISLAAHPGVSSTNLFGSKDIATLMRFVQPVEKLVFQPPERGALPTLFAATSPNAEPGGYYGPNGLFELRGTPAAAFVPLQARSQSNARLLWDKSEELTGVRYLFA